MQDIKLGKYRHYRGNLYEVIGTAKDSETLQDMVVYKALYENEFDKNQLWVRPKTMFLEKVKLDGKEVSRFMYVGENK